MAGAAAAQELRPWDAGAPPPFALSDLEGKLHRLEAYRGRVVLVNFWATWCEPCREEMPGIERLRIALEGRPFAVLAINLAEPPSRVRAYLEKMPLGFPVLLDPDAATAKAWKARILPASFLIGADGKIRYSSVGEIDWSKDNLRRTVVALLPH